ncbi:MAG: 50S ribosomal protein L10 [Candidatus Omnitrophota bacterium]
MAHLEKKYIVKEVSDYFKKSSGLIVANFNKISVVAMDSLRRKLEKNSAKLIVTKNTLIKRALNKAKLDDAAQFVDRATGVAVYQEDPVTVTKTLFDFSKDHEEFKIRGGIVEGTLIDEVKTRELSELPSKDVLIATVVMRMKSPINGLVNVLAGPVRGLVIALNQINKQKSQKG